MGRFDFSSSPAYHAYVCPDSFFSFQRIKENCMHIFAKKKHFFVRFFLLLNANSLVRSLLLVLAMSFDDNRILAATFS